MTRNGMHKSTCEFSLKVTVLHRDMFFWQSKVFRLPIYNNSINGVMRSSKALDDLMHCDLVQAAIDELVVHGA